MGEGRGVIAVQRVFAARRALFEAVELAGVACESRAEAEALCRDVRDERVGFPVQVPPTPQILAERALPGYLGLVTRGDLPPEVAEAVFADDAGEVVGPVRYAGRDWVFRLLLPKQPQLNEAVYRYCEGLLASDTAGT